MSDQAEPVVELTVEPTVDPAVVATQETGEEPTEAPAEPEKAAPYSEAQQKVFNDAMGKKAGQTREQRERADGLQRDLDELRAQIPENQEPIIPDLPGEFDDDFEAQMSTRDQAIEARSIWRVNQSHVANQQAQATQQANADAVAAINQVAADYNGNAQKLGISDAEIKYANSVVFGAGMDEGLSMHIARMPKGPSVTKYLSDNPQALDAITAMDPMAAAVYINDHVLPLAAPKAPDPTIDPPAHLEGGALMPAEKDDGITYN